MIKKNNETARANMKGSIKNIAIQSGIKILESSLIIKKKSAHRHKQDIHRFKGEEKKKYHIIGS